MAKAANRNTAAPAFNVAEFLQRSNAPKRSLLGMLADKTDDLVGRASHRVGRVTESLSGLGDIYDLGTKEGAIDSTLRVRRFEQLTADRIREKLTAAGVEVS